MHDKHELLQWEKIKSNNNNKKTEPTHCCDGETEQNRRFGDKSESAHVQITRSQRVYGVSMICTCCIDDGHIHANLLV